MTFSIRHTRAAAHSSSIVAFRRRQQSRRASSATSSPILFRYLNASATVFAGEYTRTATFSTSCSSTISVRARPEKRTILSLGPFTFGAQALFGMASHTSRGAWVVRSWNASAESRQMMPFGTRRAASAMLWRSSGSRSGET